MWQRLLCLPLTHVMEGFYSCLLQGYSLELYFVLNKVELMANAFKRNCFIYVKYKTIIKNLCSPTTIEVQFTFIYYPASYSEFRGIWLHLKASYSDLGLLQGLNLAGK